MAQLSAGIDIGFFRLAVGMPDGTFCEVTCRLGDIAHCLMF